MDSRMEINVPIKGKSDVHEMFNGIESVALNIAINTQSVLHRTIDHAAVGGCEQYIVFEEVAVTQNATA